MSPSGAGRVERGDDPHRVLVEAGDEVEPAAEAELGLLERPAAGRRGEVWPSVVPATTSKRRGSRDRPSALARGSPAPRTAARAAARPDGACAGGAASNGSSCRRPGVAARSRRRRSPRYPRAGSTRASARSAPCTRPGSRRRGSTRRLREAGRRCACGGSRRRSRSPRASSRRAGRVVARLDPAHHHGGEGAVREDGRQSTDEVGTDAVAAEPAVAEDEARLGRDDVRRVCDDEVELLARDRLEEAALPKLDVLDAVQRAVECCERERPLADVRRDDVLGVPRGEQRLDAVAGADVERALDRPAHGEVRERERGALDARHVVGTGVGRSEAITRSSCGIRRIAATRRPPGASRDEPEPLEARGAQRRELAVDRRPRRRSRAGRRAGSASPARCRLPRGASGVPGSRSAARATPRSVPIRAWMAGVA